MSTEWAELAEKFGRRMFKDHAPIGKYKVKVKDAKVTATSTGSIRVVFTFEDDDNYQYPRSAAHWISRNNVNWTKWHHKCMFEVLGASEANAKKGIDNIEKGELTTEQAVAGYQEMYTALCDKHPQVEVVVREQRDRDGDIQTMDNGVPWTEAEFADERVFSSNLPKQKPTEILEQAEEVQDDLADIPF